MTVPSFDASSGAFTRLELGSRLDMGQIEALKKAIDEWPAGRPPPALLIDLRDLETVDSGLRPRLVDIHQALKVKAGRSVYLAVKPVLRGLALWILHLAGDQQGSVAGTERQARAWLESDEGRVASFFDALGKPQLPLRASDGPLPPLSLRERAVARIGGFFTRVSQGYWLAFLEELIRTFGVEGLQQIGEQNEEVLAALAERWDAETAQLVVGMGALWNGCGYCGAGHIYAANLLHFQRTNDLLPLDERDVPRLQKWTDSAILEELMARFTGPLEGVGQLVRRQFDLKVGGTEPEDEADELLLRACAAWDIVNECSIVVDMSDVPPLNPAMAKDRALQRRYRRRRQAA